MNVYREDNRFCIEAQGIYASFLDSEANRKTVVVLLRWLRHSREGRPSCLCVARLPARSAQAGRQVWQTPAAPLCVPGSGFICMGSKTDSKPLSQTAWPSSASLLPDLPHLLCHFHHQQGVTP